MNPGAASPAPTAIHASAVVVSEAGIVLRGASGAGKSSLALALLEAAGQTGCFAALIGDDRLFLSARNARLVVRGHPAIYGKIERRGLGIFDIGAEPAAVVRLVVDISTEPGPRYPEAVNPYVTLCGIEVPLLTLPKRGSACDSAQLIMARLRQSGVI